MPRAPKWPAAPTANAPAPPSSGVAKRPGNSENSNDCSRTSKPSPVSSAAQRARDVSIALPPVGLGPSASAESRSFASLVAET